MNNSYDDHPFAAVFPLLEDSEFFELGQDISANGLKQPITLLDGKILDGRNRYRACLAVGVEPWFEQYNGDTPVADVISWNVRRRQLTKTQIAAVLLEALPLLEAEKERVRLSNLKQNAEGAMSSPSAPKGKSSDVLGQQNGVSGRLIRQVKFIKENNPERFEQVRLGKMLLAHAKYLTQREVEQNKQSARIEEDPRAFSEQKTVGFLDDLPIFEGGPFIRPGWAVWGYECVPEYFKPHIKWTPEEQAAALAEYVPQQPPPQVTPITEEEIEADYRRQVEEQFKDRLEGLEQEALREIGIPPETTRRWIVEYINRESGEQLRLS